MKVNYEVELTTSMGDPICSLNDFIELDYARTFGEVGSLVISLPDHYDPTYFDMDNQIRVYRSVGGRPPYLDMDTIWLIDGFRYIKNSRRWIVSASDLLSILNRRIVAYTRETTYADKTQEELGNDNQLHADDCAKAYVRENFSTEALDEARRISTDYFSIEEDRSAAPKIEKEASFQILLDVVKDICNSSEAVGVPLYFDIYPMEKHKFEFRTFTDFYRSDRGTTALVPLIFNDDTNLTDVEIAWDYQSVFTHIYVGGEGAGSDRIVELIGSRNLASISPWSRRELFVEEQNADAITYLQDVGRGRLEQSKPRISITGTILNVAGSLYGFDYFYGDKVGVFSRPWTFNCLVSSVRVTLGDGRERIEAKLQGDIIFTEYEPPEPGPEPEEEIWLQGFVDPDVVVMAFEPYNAADIGSSYFNLANPGTNNAVPFDTPGLSDGWVFPGTSSPDPEVYLTTTPSADTIQTIICSYTGVTPGSAQMAVGASGGVAGTDLYLQVSAAQRSFANGGIANLAGETASGIMAVSGPNAYFNGTLVASGITARTGSIGASPFIGALNAPGFANPLNGTITHLYFYSAILSGPQIAAITAAIQADMA